MFYDESIHSNIFWMHKNDLPKVRELAKASGAEVKHRPFKRGDLNALAGKVIFTGHSWKAKMEGKAAFWQSVKAAGLNVQS